MILRCKRIVLAAGAIERPIVFANNDRPGVMQASAARAYAKRFGVAAGGRVLVFGAHDEAYGAALDLMAAGVELRGLVDPRAERSPMADKLEVAGAEVLQGQAVVKAEGGQILTGGQARPEIGPNFVEPTIVEIGEMIMCFGIFILSYTIFTKLFPVISIAEVKELALARH